MSDPMVQIIIALCEHPAYADGCDDCERRRVEAAAYLVTLCDRALGAITALEEPPA